jgi:hypothetical protein
MQVLVGARLTRSQRVLDFSADQFRQLSGREQANLCVRSAERAHELAETAIGVQKLIFANIASQWLHLADVIRTEDNRQTSTNAPGPLQAAGAG